MQEGDGVEVIPTPIPVMTRGVYLMDVLRKNKVMVEEGVLLWEERMSMNIMLTHGTVSFLYGTGRVLMQSMIIEMPHLTI